MATPPFEEKIRGHVCVVPDNMHMSNLKSVTLTVLELLALNPQI